MCSPNILSCLDLTCCHVRKYELCNQFGICLIDEANETRTLASNAAVWTASDLTVEHSKNSGTYRTRTLASNAAWLTMEHSNE